MVKKTAFIYGDVLATHSLSESHPLKPARLRYTFELLEEYGAFKSPRTLLVPPRMATETKILEFHSLAYLRAVKALSIGGHVTDPSLFNFGPGDNPTYEGMYEAALWSTGASILGAELLTSDKVDTVFSISGGLHHAMPSYAAGFCVFNDPVIAINELVQNGMRVAYVDIDCHHGDGVQYAFYDTNRVLTISIHEAAKFIFPGTGFVQETGVGRGLGYSVNVPLYPFTTDEVYMWVFRETVIPLVESFRPDAIVTQLGIDSHYKDPITHLALTVQGFGSIVGQFVGMAPKWLALGGGGYDLQAVARAWTIAYGVMSEQKFSDYLPSHYRERHGAGDLLDREDLRITDKVRKDAWTFAKNSVQSIKCLIFPTHGLSSGEDFNGYSG